MQRPSNSGSLRGVVALFLFGLGAIFIGPLEAVLGLALYWLVSGSESDGYRTG